MCLSPLAYQAQGLGGGYRYLMIKKLKMTKLDSEGGDKVGQMDSRRGGFGAVNP